MDDRTTSIGLSSGTFALALFGVLAPIVRSLSHVGSVAAVNASLWLTAGAVSASHGGCCCI